MRSMARRPSPSSARSRAWRTMAVDDVGVDVFQLEANLVDLGYDPDGELTVDDTFTDYTADVVERWQEDLALEVTGRVALGSVVFVPSGSTTTTTGRGRRKAHPKVCCCRWRRPSENWRSPLRPTCSTRSRLGPTFRLGCPTDRR